MAEFNRRLAVLGLKQAEKDFARYLEKRVAAEKSTKDLERELEQAGRAVGAAFQEAKSGR